MAENKYYWLKLKRDFFKRHDIRIIEEMPNGKDYILFYLKMLLESIDHNGELRFNDTIPYNEQMLSVITNTNIDIVRAAMKVFIQLGMIEIFDDETIYMREMQTMIGSESASAERVRKHRALIEAKTNAERQRAHRAKKACEDKQHIPYIEDYMNKKRYGGNYYVVINRDKFKCAICGSIENLCVHHIDGYDENKPENNAENKMITLCRKCHSNIHSQGAIPIDILERIGYSNESNVTSNVTCNTEIEIDIEKDKELDKEKDKRSAKPARHKYGEYKNVLLSDEDIEKLKAEFPDDWEKRIERLSGYIASTGKSYKNHLATIRNWAKRDKEKGAAEKKQKNDGWCMPNADDDIDLTKIFG